MKKIQHETHVQAVGEAKAAPAVRSGECALCAKDGVVSPATRILQMRASEDEHKKRNVRMCSRHAAEYWKPPQGLAKISFPGQPTWELKEIA